MMKLLSGDLLSKGNADRCVRILYDAAKIIYERQQRLRKSQLKMKEIASALVLVEFHHSNAYRFKAEAELAENFGDCPEAKALDYYEHRVMGEVLDAFGRKIVIDEAGMKSLYKERGVGNGKHVIATENYEQFRGKRLPWIRHVLQNSRAVYVAEEVVQGKFRRTYLYTAIPSIPLEPKPQISYYLVVVREDKNKNLRFITAYDVFNYNRFLRYIEPNKPFRRTESEQK